MFGTRVVMDDDKKDEKKGKECNESLGPESLWMITRRMKRRAKSGMNECLGPECSWMMTRRMKRRAKSAMNVWEQSALRRQRE